VNSTGLVLRRIAANPKPSKTSRNNILMRANILLRDLPARDEKSCMRHIIEKATIPMKRTRFRLGFWFGEILIKSSRPTCSALVAELNTPTKRNA
jgi:hypothetical protein